MLTTGAVVLNEASVHRSWTMRWFGTSRRATWTLRWKRAATFANGLHQAHYACTGTPPAPAPRLAICSIAFDTTGAAGSTRSLEVTQPHQTFSQGSLDRPLEVVVRHGAGVPRPQGSLNWVFHREKPSRRLAGPWPCEQPDGRCHSGRRPQRYQHEGGDAVRHQPGRNGCEFCTCSASPCSDHRLVFALVG